MAGARLLTRYPYNPVPEHGKLTLSSGVITDDTRTTGTEGDGAAYPDSSVGVWPAATNYILNSNCATNADNIDPNASATVSRATDRYKFGGTSLKVLCPGLGGSEGANYRTAVGTAAPSDIRSAEIWVYHEASGSLNFYVQIVWRDSGGSALSPTSGSSTAVAPFTWTRLTVTGTAPASTDRADVKAIKSSTSTDTFWVGGVQLETGSNATPYIHTDGGTASRSAGSITAIPAGVLDETRMWVMARIRVDSTQAGSGRIFSFGDSSNERLEMVITSTTNRTSTLRQTGGAGATATAASGTIAVGDAATYIGGWDANFCYAANNGAALTSAANTSIPTLSATDAALGKQGFASFGYPGVSFKWLAIGLAAPTDALSALGYAWGNNDPLPHMFPASAQLSFLAHFNGDGTFYRRSA